MRAYLRRQPSQELNSAMSKSRLFLVSAALLGIALSTAEAQHYPTHPIRLVVGFVPGSGADVTARILATSMSKDLGQQIVVENRSGAGSSIAAESVVRAHKDGYTIFMGTVANIINAAIKPLPFDFSKDFAPIVLVSEAPNILVVHPSLGVHTLSELIALAKAKPGELTFGSSGVGTSPHVSGELFNIRARVQLLRVPYQGSAQAMTDLLGGRLSMMSSPASTAISHIRSGKITALASTTLKRPAVAPDLPTIHESGLPGFETALWFGLNAPAGTPRDIIEKLAQAANSALNAPEVASALQVQGIEPVGGTPEDYGRYIVSETGKWTAVAKTTDLTK
jgi:tripartite-type tricarboxylate transporter receptor subunit TctC